MIVNYLTFPIFLRQSNKNPSRIVKIKSGHNTNYQFDDIKTGPYVQISENKEDWSGAFSLNNLEDFQIRFKAAAREIPKKKNIFAKDEHWYLSSAKNNFFYYVRVHVFSEDDASIQILFSNPRVPHFKIHNATKEQMIVKQSKTKDPGMIVFPGTCVPWAFDDHLKQNKKVTVKIAEYKQKYSLEKIKETNKDIGDHGASVKFQEESRVLTIYDVEETQEEIFIDLLNNITEIHVQKLRVSLFQVNLSLLNEENSENFLVSLNEISFKSRKVQEKRQRQIKTRNKVNLIIGKFQIDNMNFNKNYFPIIAYQSEVLEKTPFFDLRYDREYSTGDINSSFIVPIDRILEFEVQMQQLNLHLNYEIFTCLYSLQKMYYLSFYHKIENSSKNAFFDLNTKIQIPEYQPQAINSYFKYVRIHGIKIVLTFGKCENYSFLQESSELMRSVSSICLDLASIEESQLNFTEIILLYSLQNSYTLVWFLMKNYIKQALLQFYKILGASQILGNPIGLIDKLGTGVYEFFNEPAKGLLRGPKGFINGLEKGVRSLVSNVIVGSFQSVANITGSLYKIISYENFTSDNIFENLGLSDIKSGINGIIMKPYNGYKEYGAKGLITGIGSGVLGVVVSPVAAVLHFSTTVSAKVAKTAELFNKKRNITGRIRYPRNINSISVLEPYDENLAKFRYLFLMKNFEEEFVVVAELEKE